MEIPTLFEMKKLLAIFFAVVLAPTFNTYAWIGGPFSNNSYFGEVGDEGVYEGIATGPNAIGIFRIVVANDFAGSQSLDTGITLVPGLENFNVIGTVPTTTAINSGNIFIGGFGLNEGPSSNIWFFQGVSYFGRCSGTVNSAQGIVTAVANANERGNGTRSLDSGFFGTLDNDGDRLPSTSFTGAGQASETTTGTAFSFTVFGTKVSSAITFGL